MGAYSSGVYFAAYLSCYYDLFDDQRWQICSFDTSYGLGRISFRHRCGPGLAWSGLPLHKSYRSPNPGGTLCGLCFDSYIGGLPHDLHADFNMGRHWIWQSERIKGAPCSQPHDIRICSLVGGDHCSNCSFCYYNVFKRRWYCAVACRGTYGKAISYSIGQAFTLHAYSIFVTAATSTVLSLRIRTFLTDLLNTILEPEIIFSAFYESSHAAGDIKDQIDTSSSIAITRLIQLSYGQGDIT